MSIKGKINRGKKWYFIMNISNTLKEQVEESMKKNPAIKEDIEAYKNTLKTNSKKDK